MNKSDKKFKIEHNNNVKEESKSSFKIISHKSGHQLYDENEEKSKSSSVSI